MTTSFDWKMFYASRDKAIQKGQEIASAYDFTVPPVDVFTILQREQQLIHAVGEDFGDAFDGRIKYLGSRFLVCYNTKYNAWPHAGQHHSKVLFSIAHELGHFYLERHRQYLVSKRRPHGSFSEFSVETLVESEADHFACGLLMPHELMGQFVNAANFPTINDFMEVRRSFNVSLTGLLARWTQVSDFPCATLATKDGRILFGWVSEAFRNRGCFRVRKGHAPHGRSFKAFILANQPVVTYQHREASGLTDYWLDWENRSADTAELYFAIPHSNQVWVHVMCDECELSDDRYD